MTKAAIYVRFSDRRDSEFCQSNDMQLEVCRKYCAEHGHAVVSEWPDDAVSGAEEDRPVLWNAIASLKRGMVLVVYRADRLARNVYLHELIYRAVKKRHATIEVVDGGRNGDSAEDELLRTVMAAFAAYERRVIAARTKAASLRHQRNGRAMSAVAPYGKKAGPVNAEGKRTWVDDEAERFVISRIVMLRSEGLGLREIARALHANRIQSRDGGDWTHTAIGRILAREGALDAKTGKSVAQNRS